MDEKLGLSYFIPSNNGIWQVLGGSRNNEHQFYTLTSPLLKSMSNKWLNDCQTPVLTRYQHATDTLPTFFIGIVILGWLLDL